MEGSKNLEKDREVWEGGKEKAGKVKRKTEIKNVEARKI